MSHAEEDAPARLAFEEALMCLDDLSSAKWFGARVACANEHVALVLDGEALVAYLGEAQAAAAIALGRATPWSPMGPGKGMKGYVVLPEEDYAESPAGVMPWALAARAATLARPPKSPKSPKKKSPKP